MLVSPVVDVSSDMTADVIWPVSPLPLVTGHAVGTSCSSVSGRRRSSRDPSASVAAGSVERSPDSIRSLGAGCAFRNTTNRSSDYTAPSGEFGLPMHHPRFLE